MSRAFRSASSFCNAEELRQTEAFCLVYKNTVEGARNDEETQFESRSCGAVGTTEGVDPRRKKLAAFAGRAVCAVLLAAVVGAVGVQNAAAETEAEAVSKANRAQIDGCFEQYEEGIKQIKAGATQDGKATVFSADYVLSKAMKYKEWTKADSDRYSALKKRYEQAVAEAASKFRRVEIGQCLELYEEGIKQIEAGNELESQGTIWAATSGLSAVMKYKEWTKADGDKYSALKQRHEQALKKKEQAQAAAAATTPRGKIDTYLKLFEEATVAFEADNRDAGFKIMQQMQWQVGENDSQLRAYKEWTQADSDRVAALTDRFNAAYYGKGVWAMMKKRLEEPYASQELLDAIRRDDAAAVKKLIAQGEDPNVVIMGTPTPVLWEAAKQNKPKAARALIESGADVLFKFKSNNATILHQAAFYGGRELLTVLLDAGAKKYVNEVSGQTPAMLAASIVNLEALKVLMAYGADLNKKVENEKGVPIGILMYVHDRVTSEAAGRLADSGDIKAATKKWEQGKKNEADFISFLIKSGVNKKADLSAALFSCEANSAAMKILIDAGADVNYLDKDGNYPLFSAINSAYGVEEGFKTGGGIHITPYVIESIKLLIAAGANVNARDEHGNTPLHQASISFRGFTDLPEIIRILLDAGAKVDARNNDGKTPLMVAAGNNAAENAEALIAAGADVNAKDKGGHTPLYYATGPGCYKAAPAIRYYGGVGEYK